MGNFKFNTSGILDANSARDILCNQLIDEINHLIREACECHKNYIIYEFENVSGPTLKLIKFLIEQYEDKGYKIAAKNETTYMLSW